MTTKVGLSSLLLLLLALALMRVDAFSTTKQETAPAMLPVSDFRPPRRDVIVLFATTKGDALSSSSMAASSTVTPANNKKTKKKRILGQRHPRTAWRNMSLYWITCAMVAHLYGRYFSSWRFWQLMAWGNPGVWKRTIVPGGAVLATWMAKQVMCSRNITYGRPDQKLPSLWYALWNGTMETFMFFATYDFGKALGSLLGWPSIATGFAVYFVYGALIHVGFWLPWGLPPHSNPNAPNFALHALPALTAMSAGWLACYEVFRQSMVVPILLHIWFNYKVSRSMHLPAVGDAPVLYGDE